ncbi:MAG: RNA 2',3'-cyclic phosphodiesterase [candidate division Zixibacteria bacterium]|nr:RNA 2',3'-cyclic phosphodiesterase [candidate division Zixibacteria bacterium]
MLRLFIALPLTSTVKQKLEQVSSELRKHGGKVKWVDPKNIHVTLRFLGDTEERIVDAIGTSLNTIARNHNTIESTIDRLGGFPNLQKPRVVWAGLSGEREIEALTKLATEVEQAMCDLGFEPDNKRFRPHLTLARVKAPQELEPLVAELKSYQFDPTPLRLDRLVLFKSTLTPQGPIYERLHEVPLGKQEQFGG